MKNNPTIPRRAGKLRLAALLALVLSTVTLVADLRIDARASGGSAGAPMTSDTAPRIDRSWLRLAPPGVYPSVGGEDSLAHIDYLDQLALAASSDAGSNNTNGTTGQAGGGSGALPPHPSRVWSPMTYDPSTGRTLIFGGKTLQETWIWDGTGWTQLQPASSPPPRFSAAIAGDGAKGNVVLFGGRRTDVPFGPATLPSDTWIWNGANWTEQHPSTSPRGRYDGHMVYDAARGKVVLFGGFYYDYITETFKMLNDTWTWDGTTWKEEHPPSSPPGRDYANMTYDAVRGQVVLYGGAEPYRPF